MGHDNLNTTQVYLAVTDKAKKAAISRLDQPKADTTIDNAASSSSELLRTTPGLITQSLGYSGVTGQPLKDTIKLLEKKSEVNGSSTLGSWMKKAAIQSFNVKRR